MSYMLSYTDNFVGDLSSWDASSVTNESFIHLF